MKQEIPKDVNMQPVGLGNIRISIDCYVQNIISFGIGGQ